VTSVVIYVDVLLPILVSVIEEKFAYDVIVVDMFLVSTTILEFMTGVIVRTIDQEGSVDELFNVLVITTRLEVFLISSICELVPY